MPLVRPFRTSFGVQETRDVLLVHVVTDVGEGWGECAAHAEPFYNEEFTESALMVLRRWLVPAVLALPTLTGDAVGPACRQVKGYRAAKAGLEMAVLDAELRADGRSLATRPRWRREPPSTSACRWASRPPSTSWSSRCAATWPTAIGG